ncbi:hypothetical protein DFP73DRAFT_530611 [Morchella snyderi]|nr:hypothetical protein DFP73DRAFT_530611 [Morchella snyderi]
MTENRIVQNPSPTSIMSSSSILDESLKFQNASELVTAEDYSDSDWGAIINRFGSKSPELDEPPQSPLHSVTLALSGIKGLFADPSTIKEFNESIKYYVAPDMRNLTSSVDSIRKDMEANSAELELYKVWRSHLRKAIKELKIVNSPMLTSITHEDDSKAEDKPKLAMKRHRLGSPPEDKSNTTASKSRKLEEISPCLSQADQYESFHALTTAQSPPPIAPPRNSIACKFQAFSVLWALNYMYARGSLVRHRYSRRASAYYYH